MLAVLAAPAVSADFDSETDSSADSSVDSTASACADSAIADGDIAALQQYAPAPQGAPHATAFVLSKIPSKKKSNTAIATATETEDEDAGSGVVHEWVVVVVVGPVR